MKLCETQLIAEEDYKFARTHTFALLTMVIVLCTIKHLWIWACWTNCTVFFMSILVYFFNFKFVLLENFCSCCYYNYIASLTSYWTKLYRKLAACSLYHTGVVLEQKYNIKLICQYGYVSSCKVQTYTYNEPGRYVTWTALVISMYSVWDVTWTAINALVISSDLCSV